MTTDRIYLFNEGESPLGFEVGDRVTLDADASYRRFGVIVELTGRENGSSEADACFWVDIPNLQIQENWHRTRCTKGWIKL